MGMKNLLFAAYRFPPCGGGGVQRPAKFAKYLPEFGYKPLVLTGNVRRKKYSVDRALLNELGDTAIHACHGREEQFYQRLRKMGLGSLARLFLLPDKEVLWLPGAERTALQLAQQQPIHAIYTTIGPRSCALLGLRLKKLLGVPWILDYRDPWTTGGRLWPTPFHRWYDVRQERRAVQVADAIVVVTPTMKDLLVEKFPEATDKVHVICNGFDEHDFENMSQKVLKDRLRIGYTGSLANYKKLLSGAEGAIKKLLFGNVGRDFSTHTPRYLLEAVRALLDEHPDYHEKIELRFAGNFGKANLRHVQQLGLEHVVSVKGYLPHAQSLQLLMDSDVLFLPMLSTPGHPRSYIHSAKTFEYLAAGKPILAAVPEGDARDLVTRARAGWCVEPRDVGAMKELLRELVERKLSAKLRIDPDRQFIRQFERRKLTRQLATLCDSLISNATRGRIDVAGPSYVPNTAGQRPLVETTQLPSSAWGGPHTMGS